MYFAYSACLHHTITNIYKMLRPVIVLALIPVLPVTGHTFRITR